MKWQGDRCDYLPWLQERLFPDDWEGQKLVLWAVYENGLDLSWDPDEELPANRHHLADQELLRSASN